MKLKLVNDDEDVVERYIKVRVIEEDGQIVVYAGGENGAEWSVLKLLVDEFGSMRVETFPDIDDPQIDTDMEGHIHVYKEGD
jgi:hypothetical protein